MPFSSLSASVLLPRDDFYSFPLSFRGKLLLENCIYRTLIFGLLFLLFFTYLHKLRSSFVLESHRISKSPFSLLTKQADLGRFWHIAKCTNLIEKLND